MGPNNSPFQAFEFPASLAVGRGHVTVLADEMQGEVQQDWKGFCFLMRGAWDVLLVTAFHFLWAWDMRVFAADNLGP